MVEAQDSVVLRPAGIDITREMPTFFRIYLDTEEECALEQQTCTQQYVVQQYSLHTSAR